MMNVPAEIAVGSTQWAEILRTGAEFFDIRIDSEQMHCFAVHAGELIKWNRKINLTAISDPLEIAIKHILDSITPALIVPQGAAMLDIGSGGGFPGIPLKILMPSLSVTLVDASRKKVSFLNHVIRTLALEDIRAVHVRAETLAQDDGYREAFDVIISRALTALDGFIEMALPLLKPEGMIIALKGRLPEEDVKPARALIKRHNMSLTIQKCPLPLIEASRTIVSLRRKA